jgi:hypothetical protein
MGQAHVVEEEEVGLLLVKSSELERVPHSEISKEVEPLQCRGRQSRHDTLSTWWSFAQVGEEGGVVNSARWVVNTGATNHMSGTRTAFIILDTGVYGAMRFSDGSMVRIKG